MATWRVPELTIKQRFENDRSKLNFQKIMTIDSQVNGYNSGAFGSGASTPALQQVGLPLSVLRMICASLTDAQGGQSALNMRALLDEMLAVHEGTQGKAGGDLQSAALW